MTTQREQRLAQLVEQYNAVEERLVTEALNDRETDALLAEEERLEKGIRSNTDKKVVFGVFRPWVRFE